MSQRNVVFEQTFESGKMYADPFNETEVDVIFQKGDKFWRVPAFWRGGNKWSVRFAPPEPGDYAYHLECTDKDNKDLNGHETRLQVSVYEGANALLKHGPLRVSQNRRYFEHADGKPFFWLGDTWWTGLSSRLPWEGFQKLTADRKAKGFTVVQLVAGLVPFEEKPFEPGFVNEGGAVWEEGFARINPGYFDAADRRIQHLVDAEIVPAIVGAWSSRFPEIGLEKMKKHWRYVVARYGAYPVFWILGGESYDRGEQPWTDVACYLKQVDPFRRPMTVHEVPWSATTLKDESLMDFDMFQPGHSSWGYRSPAVQILHRSVADLTWHYSRTSVTKPGVTGEIGYEALWGQHYEDFQRCAFWISMLNGAAGHTYGANGTWESYSVDAPLHWMKWSFYTWEEGMNLPGSYQIGINKKLLEQYPWWRFTPHPEWVEPHGTTLLEPHSEIAGVNYEALFDAKRGSGIRADYLLPYAAGIPEEVRFIYCPALSPSPPTLQQLESGVRYKAFWWDPTFGIKVDIGLVQRPEPGDVVFEDRFAIQSDKVWADHATPGDRGNGALVAGPDALSTVERINEANAVVTVNAQSTAAAGIVLRYHDDDNYLLCVYNSDKKEIGIYDRQKGHNNSLLGKIAVGKLEPKITLNAEVRGGWAVFSVGDGTTAYTTPIVQVKNTTTGKVGVCNPDKGDKQEFGAFVVRHCGTIVRDEHLEKQLYDARGQFRGELTGTGWDDYGKEKVLLLDAYLPRKPPTVHDWVFVMDRVK